MYEMFLFNSVNSKITQNVNEEFILKYSDYSCEQLNSLWKEVGLGSYYNGLFKIIEPNDLKDIINQCYIMDDDESLLPFMCTAFGDVFAYVKNKRFGNYVVFLNIRAQGTRPECMAGAVQFRRYTPCIFRLRRSGRTEHLSATAL